MTRDVEHLFCHLYIFLGAVSIKGFGSFFKRMVCFFYCWMWRVLCIFWIIVLYQMRLLHIFWLFSFSWQIISLNHVYIWNPKYVTISKSQWNLLTLYLTAVHFSFSPCLFSCISKDPVPDIILLLPEKHSLVFFQCECSGDESSPLACLKMSLFDNNNWNIFSGI